MFAFADDRAIPECKEQILQAIQHFSSRNLVAARRYEYLEKVAPFYTNNGNVFDLADALKEVKEEFPDA